MTRRQRLLQLQEAGHQQLRDHHTANIATVAKDVVALNRTVEAIQDMLAGATRMLGSAKEAAVAAQQAAALAQAMIVVLSDEGDVLDTLATNDAELRTVDPEEP